MNTPVARYEVVKGRITLANPPPKVTPGVAAAERLDARLA